MGRTVPGLKDSSTYALTLFNTVLGEGMSSRLFQRIRERHGYAYHIYSFLNQYEDTGALGIYTGADAGTIDRCEDLTFSELKNLSMTPVSPRELKRAREQVIGSLVLGLESMTSRMTRIGKDELVFRRNVSLEEIISELASVTPEEIGALAKSICRKEDWFSTAILPIPG
jgi:predicted Zn-dependent peptidase